MKNYTIGQMLKNLFVPNITFSQEKWIDEHKYVTLSILLSSSVLILLFFLVLRYIQGDMHMVKIDAAAILIVGTCALILRYNVNNYNIVSRLAIFLSFTLALINMNFSQDSSRSIWLAFVVVAAFYFRDKKEGILWTTFFVTFTLVAEVLSVEKVSMTRSIDYFTLIINFILISVLLSWYEKIKERDKDYLINQTKLLEEKVAERTQELEKISITDELTGMYNRRYLYQIIDRVIKTQRRDNNRLVFAMMDIDGFKEYNDTYGHFAGDEALKKVADVIKKNLGRGNDYAFRIGGEEFCIIMIDLDPALAFNHIEKIRQDIAELKITHEKNTDQILTVSFGVEDLIPDSATHIDTIYKSADKKLYIAKEQGRNTTVM